MSTRVFLGIDIGTSGIRGCCINDDAEELINHQIAFDDQITLSDGKHEQDPYIWLQKLDQLLTEISDLLLQLDTAYRIKAITLDGTSSTLIACKKDGTALSPALMYNDQQSQLQAEIIKRFAPTNSAVHGASSSLAKALLLLQRHPDTELFCHQANWLAASLNGQYNISDENNCLKFGYDSISQSWPTWLLHNSENATVPATTLPQVVAAGTKLNNIHSALIKKYQLDEDCYLVAGTTDSNAAVLATGANSPGDAVTALGSTLVVKLFTNKPLFQPDYGIYSHRLNGHWLVGGASNSGGNVIRKYFSQSQISTMTTQLKPAQATGLNYYPLPATGERFPINDSNKKSRLQPRPESDIIFFQGILEGIANIEADGYKKLVALGATTPARVFSTGGGSINLPWRQIRENITGIKTVNASHSDACYGSALLAKQGCKEQA